MSIASDALTELAVSHRVLKRAQYEAFAFTLTSAGVRVRNESYADPSNHIYTVTVTDGVPVACSCPADATTETACKHRLAVAIRLPVIDAATQRAAAGETTLPVPVDDAMTPEPELLRDDNAENLDDASEEPPAECDCADLPGEFPCFPCFLAGRKELPDT